MILSPNTGTLQIQLSNVKPHAASAYQPVSAPIKTNATTSNYKNTTSALAFCQTNDSVTVNHKAKNTAPAVFDDNTQQSGCNWRSSSIKLLTFANSSGEMIRYRKCYASNSLDFFAPLFLSRKKVEKEKMN